MSATDFAGVPKARFLTLQLNLRHTHDSDRLGQIEAELDEENPNLDHLRSLQEELVEIRRQAKADSEIELPDPPGNARKETRDQRAADQSALQEQAQGRYERALAVSDLVGDRIRDFREGETLITEPDPDPELDPEEDPVVPSSPIQRRRSWSENWDELDSGRRALVVGLGILLFLLGLFVGIALAGSGHKTTFRTKTIPGTPTTVTATETETTTVASPSSGPVGGVHIDPPNFAEAGFVSRVRVRGPQNSRIPFHTTLGWVYLPSKNSGDLNSRCGTVTSRGHTLAVPLTGREQIVCYKSPFGGTEEMTINGQTYNFAVAP